MLVDLSRNVCRDVHESAVRCTESAPPVSQRESSWSLRACHATRRVTPAVEATSHGSKRRSRRVRLPMSLKHQQQARCVTSPASLASSGTTQAEAPRGPASLPALCVRGIPAYSGMRKSAVRPKAHSRSLATCHRTGTVAPRTGWAHSERITRLGTVYLASFVTQCGGDGCVANNAGRASRLACAWRAVASLCSIGHVPRHRTDSGEGLTPRPITSVLDMLGHDVGPSQLSVQCRSMPKPLVSAAESILRRNAPQT